MNKLFTNSQGRRDFLYHSGVSTLSGKLLFGSDEMTKLASEVGVTTGSFMRHISHQPAKGKLRMLDLPKIMNNELDMRVIDFMSRTLESFDNKYLEKLRTACDENECIVTNLKCNQKGIDMASSDPATRNEALRVYRESIDAAHILGARWIRPFAGSGKIPNRDILTDSYRALIDYGSEKNISLLIENVGWVSGDPNTIPDMISRVGEGLNASPDTGNWPNDELRYEGLAKAYPHAVSSDFKVFAYEPDGSHPKYDIEKCFQAGWQAGFRGPWCIEHFHANLPGLLEGFGKIRDQLRGWIKREQA